MRRVAFCLLFFLSSFLFSQRDSKEAKLNFLLITIDTIRADRLSCYGSRTAKTPQIDGLAQKGILFSRAFAHTPTTLPSHANMLLGVTPLDHGIHDNSNFIVRESSLTLAEHLKDDGYSTGAFIGAFPLDSRFGLTQGFEIYDDNYGSQTSLEFSYVERRAEDVVNLALHWLKERKSPWFLWIHCFDPHQPYDPPEPFKTQYRNSPYDGEVASVDFALGKLLSYLKEENLIDQTLIILTGDHGESLGEHGESTHGYFAYNATLWVPLIINVPGIKQTRVNQNVCHLDIFPTVCDVLGIEKPLFLQGASLLPLMKGKKLEEEVIYFESLYPYYSCGWAPLRGFISGNEKFIDAPIPELYDLRRDFGEATNLVASLDLDKYRERLNRLIKAQSPTHSFAAEKKIDRETQEKLQSLGYISSPQISIKEVFTPEDDLKTLLPYQEKLLKAIGSYERGQIDEGVELLKEIVARRKDFDLAYSYLAAFYKKQKKLKEAVETLRLGFQNNPLSYKIISTYGIYLIEIGLYDQAIEILKKGLAFINYDPELWNYLGVAYWNKGVFEEALDAYERALSLDENYPIVFNNLGSLYLSLFLKTKDQSAYQKSIVNFKKAIELDPNYASAYNGLGAALRQAGDLEGAIDCWKKAIELEPRFGFALYNLGLTYLTLGDKVQALLYFNKYKDVDYNSLPPQEKEKLDELIQKCRQKS